MNEPRIDSTEVTRTGVRAMVLMLAEDMRRLGDTDTALRLDEAVGIYPDPFPITGWPEPVLDDDRAIGR